MKMRLMLAVVMVGAFLPEVAQAAVVQEVLFAKGQNSTLIKQSVIRGESDQYFLIGKAGQKMEVSITALEQNAVFQIYQPGYKAGKDQDGILEIKGATLKGAGEVETDLICRDKAGKPVEVSEASTIQEKFSSVNVKPYQESK
jgi:hypothetical protein